jgi:hypothetical protein
MSNTTAKPVEVEKPIVRKPHRILVERLRERELFETLDEAKSEEVLKVLAAKRWFR